VKIPANHFLDFCHVALCDPTQRRKQFEDSIVSKTLTDKFAIAPVCDKSGAPHLLEMLRGINDR
jgi:hypothetical protein